MRGKILLGSFLGVLCFFGFIWLHTFIRLNSYYLDYGITLYIVPALFAVAGTIFYYWALIEAADAAEDLFPAETGKCVVTVSIFCLALLFALVLELTGGSVSLFGEQEIRLWSFSISKKYLLDVFAAVVFPYIMEVTFKAMAAEDLRKKSLLYGITVVLGMTLSGYLLFMAMRNVWVSDLMLIGVCTVAAAVVKYIFPKKQVRKGNAVGMVIIYAVFCGRLLWLLADGAESFSRFMYGPDWDEYSYGVHYLMENAALFGTSETLLSSAYAHDWLLNRSNYILQLLFYGGWAAVAGLLVFMAIFTAALVRMLGLKNFYIHRHQLIYTAAFSILAERTVIGTLYSFALVPYPVALPFAGENGLVTDSIVFALLLYGAWENYRYESLVSYRISDVADFLNKQTEYILYGTDGEPYEDEDCFGRVHVTVTDGTNDVFCDVECLWADGGTVGVFVPMENPEHKVFLLEYEEDGIWSPVTEPEECEAALKCFMKCRMPDCMEVERDEVDQDD